MACRGVHFAITDEQVSAVREAALQGDAALIDCVQKIEQGWDEEWLQETDKSWDAIHRCLTNGVLEWGSTPLHKCILGKQNLYNGGDYIVNLLYPREVKEVAAAIKDIDQNELRRRYDAIETDSYGSLSDDDFEYTWSWFPHLRDFFQKAAKANRAVVFSVDQ
jgi:hypothetical protein